MGVAWQLAYARSAGTELGTHHSVLLAAALWLVYTFDHWVDGIRLGNTRALTARHAFMVLQRGPMAGVWLIALAASLLLAATTLAWSEWVSGLALIACTLAYFAWVHSRTRTASLKEPAVAVIYAAGATLFSWQGLTVRGMLAAFALCALALLNLAALAAVERPIDAHHDHPSLATCRPRLEQRVAQAALGLTLAAGATSASLPEWSTLFASVATGSGLSWLWLQMHQRVDHDTNHLLADAALLLPFVGWLWI